MTNRNADFPQPEELDELSPHLRELDSFLLLDGAVWRRRLPETDAALRHAIARIDLSERPTTPLPNVRDAVAQRPPTSFASPAPPRRNTRHGLIAVAAMIAVVALLGTLLHGLVGSRQGTTAATHTPQSSVTRVSGAPTATATPIGPAWTTLPGFEGKRAVTLVGPQRAYAYMEQNAPSYNPATPSKFAPAPILTLQVTQDGGATWKSLPLPVAQPTNGQSSDYSIFNLFTQPFSCQYNAILYITLHLVTPPLPALRRPWSDRW